MICPTNLQTRALAWMNQHTPPDGSVQINDVTSMYTAINVIGPKAQELLGELTDTPLEKKDFFSMSCKVRLKVIIPRDSCSIDKDELPSNNVRCI